MTLKNLKSQKDVLNWQFANCYLLIVSSSNDDSHVKTLTNQVIQLNLGNQNEATIK